MPHIWMNHIAHMSIETRRTCEWGTSHRSMGHVSHIQSIMFTHMSSETHHTYEWVTSHIQKWFVAHIIASCRKCDWIMSHISMGRVSHIQGIMSTHMSIDSCRIRMSHVGHMNESRHSYEWVTPHIWMSHVTHMNESRHTYEWVTSLIWMSHVTHMNESRHTYEWVMSHVWMSHVTHMNESCLTHTGHNVHARVHSWAFSSAWSAAAIPICSSWGVYVYM